MSFITGAAAPSEVLASASPITQTGHGFAVGDVVTLSSGAYAKAQADTEPRARVLGVVSAVIDGNTFRVATAGRISGFTGLVAGTRYYLSATSPGALVTASPTISRLILTADSPTSGYLAEPRDQLTLTGLSTLTAERRIANQTNLIAGTALVMDTVTGSTGTNIAYSTTNGRLTLAAGGTYRISFALRQGAAAATLATARLFNVTTSTFVGPTLAAESLTSTSTFGDQPHLDFVVSVAGASNIYEIRVTTGAAGAQMRGPGTGNESGQSWLTVQQLPTSVAVPAGAVSAQPLGSYAGRAQAAAANGTYQSVTTVTSTAWTTPQPVGQRINLPVGSTENGVSVGGNLVTVANAGRYVVAASISMLSAGQLQYLQLIRNSTTVIATSSFGITAASAGALDIDWTDTLAAGDTLELRLGANSAGALAVSGVSLSVQQVPVATVADPGSIAPVDLAYGRMHCAGASPIATVPAAGAPYVTSGLDTVTGLLGGMAGSAPTATFTVGRAGFYRARAFGNTRGTSGTNGMRWGVYVNGVLAIQGTGPTADAASDDISITVEGRLPNALAVGDVVSLRPTLGADGHSIHEFELQQIAAQSVVSPDLLTPTTLSRISATLSAPQTTNLTSGTDHIRFNVVDQTVGSGITLDTATAYTSAAGVASVGRFTLKGGSTYRLTANAGLWDTGTAFASLAWFNADSNTRVGPIGTLFLSGTDGSDATVTALVTPLADTRYEVRITSGTVTSVGLASILPSVLIEQQPTSSVPYVVPDTISATTLSASQATATTQSAGLALNSPLQFTTTTGDIPYNAGTFTWTLKAGRPYEFISTVDRVNGTAGVELCYCWYNVTAGTYFGSSATAGLNGQAQGAGGAAIARLTPATDIQVQVRISKVNLTPTLIGPNGAGGAGLTAIISEQPISTIVPANSLTPTAMAEHKWTAIVDGTATLPGTVSVVTFPAVTDRVASGNIASFDGTVLTVTAGAFDVAVDALLLTMGSGAHSATFWWRATGDGIGVTYGTGANASAVSSQGFYGQGSTNWAARAVIPAGATETLNLVHSVSGNNQIIQRGSYIHVRELRPQSSVQYVVPPAQVSTSLAKGQVTTIPATQSTTSTTFVDVTGSSFTLPNSGDYLITYAAAANNNTANSSVFTVLTDGAGNLVPGTLSQMDEASGVGITGVCAGTALVTAAAGAVYKLRYRVDGNTGSILNSTVDAETSITWVQLPTTTAVSLGALTVTGTPTVGQIPVATSPTAAAWAAAPTTGIAPALLTTKGDLVGASAASTPVRVPVGTDGLALVADSTTAAGVTYGAQLERRFDQANLTVNTTLTAATTVDVANFIQFTQTTAGITVTLPNPTVPTRWRSITLENNGTTTLGVTFASGTGFFLVPNAPRTIVWDGSRWNAQDVNLAVMSESLSFRDTSGGSGNGGTLSFATRVSETNTGAFTVSGTNITCVRGGRFRVRLDIQVQSSTGFFETTTWAIRKNGTAVYATPNYIIGEIDGSGVFAQEVSMDTIVDLIPGDIITGIWTGNAGIANKNVNIEMVGSFAPILGTSVEFLNARVAGVSPAQNTPTNLGGTIQSGNLGYTPATGALALKAGRTYRLTAALQGNTNGDGNGSLTYWFSTTSAGALGTALNGAQASALATTHSVAFLNQGVLDTVFTSASDTTVFLVASVSSTSQRNITDGVVTVTQLGSTAIADQWITYTPTITGSTTNPTLPTTRTLRASYRVVGKSLHLKFLLSAAAMTGATSGNGYYGVTLPPGFTIDTTVATLPSLLNSTAGNFSGFDAMELGRGLAAVGTTTRYEIPLKVVAISTTAVGLHAGLQTSVTTTSLSTLLGSSSGGGSFVAGDTNVSYSFNAEIPIL